jgi:two-component system, OmpR family, sensor histidine kinase MtrB
MRGLRGRLAVTLVALVALTAGVLGISAYAFVDTSLHERLRDDALDQANFNLSVLVPIRFPSGVRKDALVPSGLIDAIRLRGDVETIVDVGDGDPFVSDGRLRGVLDRLSPDLRAIVADGRLGYQWTTVASRESGSQPVLVVGGRLPPTGPDFYFVFDAAPIDRALGQLRLALLSGALVLILLAGLAAGAVARGILRPVEAASRAAERIGAGDLSARVPGGGRDEFGRWARAFNEMAATLEATVRDLETAEARNRRFVSDVNHELRTPLTAIVAEASILHGHLGAMPPDAARAGELLIADVGRLRLLVEELMELSRFDAAAERVALQTIDLATLVPAIVASRLPGTQVQLAAGPLLIESDPRRLDRILGNLLDNAREHAPGSPVDVSVGLSDDAGALAVQIADRGPGVPAAALPHLFERFYKADPARTAGSSGLGLAIAAEHAALLGATLMARPRPGGGLVVELRLPVAAVTQPLPDRDEIANPGDEGGDRTEPTPRPKP